MTDFTPLGQTTDQLFYHIIAIKTPQVQICQCLEEISRLSWALSLRLSSQASNVEDSIAEVKIQLRQMELLFEQRKVSKHLQSKLALLEQYT